MYKHNTNTTKQPKELSLYIMYAKNLITLCGILTEDVKLQTTKKTNRLVTTIKLCIEQEEVNDSGDHVQFLLKCVAWDKQASELSKLKKGAKLRVFGELVKSINNYGHERINIKIDELECLNEARSKI